MSIVLKKGKATISLTKPKGNLKSHQSWLNFLVGPDFYPAVKKSFEQKRNVSRVQTGTRSVIQNEVYAAYSPRKYKRTRRLLESFIAAAGTGQTAEIVALSDINKAPAKSGASKGRYSYAAFFEEEFQKPPEDGGTFIPESAMPYRPFFRSLVSFVVEFLPQESLRSLNAVIRRKMPKTEST